jgi:hypothetical protein
MDLAWLYAWAVFTTSPVIPGILPLIPCAAVFWAAVLLTGFTHHRGWRAVTVGVFNLTGLVLAVLILVHASLARTLPFWRFGVWFGELGSWSVRFPRFRIALLCLWAAGFWIGGVQLRRRHMSYRCVTSRFDLGLGAFFALFLVQLLIQVKYEAAVTGNINGYLMLSFFALGVFAVGLARNRTEATHTFAGR